ncbi:alpha-L-fucosidase [Flavobacteriaceae bacterium MHTCC 0001]
MKNYIVNLLVIVLSFTACKDNKAGENLVSIEQVQDTISAKDKSVLDFLNLKFGMFIHYNMGTYHAEQWAKPNHDPKSFAPDSLNCSQWAKAAKSAKMNYAVFTTKHHDGFCLWDTEVTDYDVASSSYKGDIVKEYTDAFRKEGLKIGLYFSVWDRQHDIQHNSITPEKIDFTKTQLTELLTNYGEIICIVIDGWGSRWGKGPDFKEFPFAVLADHIHSIQPNCLVINHSCRADLSYTDVVHYEATHGQHIPYDNTYPSQQGPTLQPAWFWEKHFADLELKSTKSVLEELKFSNDHLSNYLLNAAPNDKGLMDDNIVKRLQEIGEEVVFSEGLETLPKLEKTHANVTINVSSKLNESHIEAYNVLDCNLFTAWKASEEDKNPRIELDFGKPETFNFISMHGGYKKSVQKFKLEALVGDQWKEIHRGGPVTFHYKGYFDNDITAQKYRLSVLEKKGIPEIIEMTLVKY